MGRKENKIIAEDTLKLITSIDKERNSIYINSKDLLSLKNEELKNENLKTVIKVESIDVVESILSRKGEGKIGVLNFASARNPGGGFLTGASAQEESIARASDLYLYLKGQDNFYKNPKHYLNGLYDNDIIYSSDVSLLKNNVGDKLSDTVNFDVITSCAVNASDIKNKGQLDLLKQVDSNMIERIENIIEISLINKVDILILGAFGCGVFGNSAYKVKSHFEKVLNSKRYKNKFKEIIFTIYERPAENKKMYNIFKSINY